MAQGYGFFMDMDEGSEETGALDGPDQESSKHMWWWQYANGDDDDEADEDTKDGEFEYEWWNKLGKVLVINKGTMMMKEMAEVLKLVVLLVMVK